MWTRKGHKVEVKDSRNVKIVIADTINQYINQQEVEIPKYLTAPPLRNNLFIGRKDKIKEVSDQLDKDNAVAIMNGWGGIGKTTLATEYYFLNIEKYDHLLWLRMIDSLPESLANPSLAKNLELELDPGNDLIDNARMVAQQLTNLKGNHLMVLDNANNIKDIHKHKDLLPQINWKVLLTTRGKLGGYTHINIDVLNQEHAQQLFYEYYLLQKDDDELNRLLVMIGRHTLTIELMAKIANNGELTIAQLSEVLKKEGLSSENLELDLSTDYDKEHDNLKEIFKAAFNYSAILDDETQASVFKHFILLPSIPVSLQDFLAWTGIEDNVKTKNALNQLVSMGWLKEELLIGEEELRVKRYFIHPLIAETARGTIEINEQEAVDFIDGIADKVNIAKYTNPLDAAEWLDFGRVLVEYYPDSEDSHISTLQNNLAQIYQDLGELQPAKELAEKALASVRKNFGEDHPSTAIRYSNLATIYQALGALQPAKELTEKALASDRKNFGEDHPHTAIRYSNLATIYQALGELQPAKELAEKALASDRKNFGEDHPITAIRYSNLAWIYKDLGELQPAKELAEKALVSAQKNFGEDHPQTTAVYNNLGMIYHALGELQPAKELAEKALASAQKNFGEDHPNTATSYANLATIYKDLGELQPAKELTEKAFIIAKKVWGEDHPNTVTIKSNLDSIG
ncbi:MAG TPA: tetratricopeptide repeat protein [bacterium]|nr:tetratricopeptide repeat protein [bacterium]